MVDTKPTLPGITIGRGSTLPVSLRLVATISVSAILLWVAVWKVDFGQLGRVVGAVNYIYIAAAVSVYFIDLGLRAARWRVLLSSTAFVSVRRLYPVLVVGYMANNLLPGRVGDLSRAYLVGQREGISASAVLASVAVERIADGLTVLLLLGGGLLFLPTDGFLDSGWLLVVTRGATITFGLAILMFVVLVACHNLWLQLIARALTALPDGVRKSFLRLLDRFILGLCVLRDPRKLVVTVGWSLVIWLVGALGYALVAGAFGVHLSAVEAITTICVVNLATAVPQAPAGLGAFEFAAERVLIVLGVATTTAFGLTVVLHAVLFIPVVAVGLGLLWRMNALPAARRGL